MQLEINHYVDEGKRQARIIEQVNRSREEIKAMQSEENRTIMFEAQVYKDKLDKYKVELYESRKKCKENERYRGLYEQLKEREEARHNQEI